MGRRPVSFNPRASGHLGRVKSPLDPQWRQNALMTIHQIQVRYEPAADRLLMQVRSTQAELFAVWLTRRMVARLFPPFRDAVTRASVAQTTPQAMPVPEAREMLEQAALARPLPGTDFKKPFTDTGSSHPLGPEPLLPAAIDLRPVPSGGLAITLREERGRRMEMTLTPELATALLRLMDSALKVAEWGLPGLGTQAAPGGPAAARAASTDEADPLDPTKVRLLN